MSLVKGHRSARALTISALAVLCQVGCESRMLTLGQLAAASTGGTGSFSSNSTGSSLAGSSSTGPEAGGGMGGVGGTTFAEPRFETIELVTELAAESTDVNDENPTLTADMHELYFTSTREADDALGAEDVWVAVRADGSDEFSPPVLVTTVNTENPDSSPSISLDGQTLWIGVERDGGLGGRDIWRFARTSTAPVEFGTPALEANINSTEDEIPRPLGDGGRIMPLASRRGGTSYTTYLASRTSTSAEFGTPEIVSELVIAGYKTTDAFLTNDGLDLYFVRGLDDLTGDLYVAHRNSVGESFAAPIALSTINSDYDERDPWLSPDGNTLYFVSDRSDSSTRPRRIYRATRTIP